MKDQYKKTEWDQFKKSEDAKGAGTEQKKGGFFSFGKAGDVKMKIKFELLRKTRERMADMELTRLLRAKIFAIYEDEMMGVDQIESVKDKIQPYLISL